ncbi:PEPxxWA-CTERM sorting domain-containing protein [Phenylobacterium sp. SCN 70-31]|uniref:PEPxxWA-CTERM sorting domain-containing protein n=1 Tax=Phenylobacterium sp. SCN 70-31 TaxID=1660129 RepID=UPI0025E24A99|nr:PEPxxWA-CTERM sorting domain-containing protein [Phenylobacterium sp. SCN 70-31]
MSVSLKSGAAALVAACAVAFAAAPAGAATTLLGPTPYTSAGDSPFAGLTFDYFHLEDFQDGLLNTPGLSAPRGAVFTGPPGSISDSVEFTPNGSSWFSGSGATGLEFVFDAGVLGALPTHAGLVWTDGRGTITFEAFDLNGVSLGVVTGDHADTSQTGETGEDRFYGVIHAAGISRILIKNQSGGIEADHVQYGRQTLTAAVPEPTTWAMMILGFGAAGALLRRRRAAPVAAPVAEAVA